MSSNFSKKNNTSATIASLLILGFCQLAAFAGEPLVAPRQSQIPAQNRSKMQVDTKSADYWIELAHDKRLNPKSADAHKYLTTALTYPPPKRFNNSVSLVQDLVAENKLELAQSFIDQVKAQSPLSPDWLVLQGIFYKAQEEPTQAEVFFKRASEAPAKKATKPLEVAACGLQEIGCAKESLELQDKIVKLFPYNKADLQIRGICLLDLNRLNEAQQCLRQRLREDNTDGPAMEVLLRVDQKLKDWKAVISDSKTLPKVTPNKLNLRLVLGIRGDAFAALGDNNAAIAEYSHSLKLFETQILYKKRSQCYKAIGKLAEAAADEKRIKILNETEATF